MKIYTKRGDDGDTELFGGARLPKHSPRIEAYGSVDELNAHLGAVVAALERPRDDDIAAAVESAQRRLFEVGADLATPATDDRDAASAVPRLTGVQPREVEAAIDAFDGELPALRVFILPSGTPAATTLHVARGVCRRAERRVAELAAGEPVNEHVLVYLNRLSDLLFVLARAVNSRGGVGEAEWNPRAEGKDT
ncbi:ATP:cob(I)alamin adenosyltransferase [Candidatus Poribacteria bacterium]|nr:ATP:cob(I)alamin adenosyltransferase [Candidatus Poribacteria bacterium]